MSLPKEYFFKKYHINDMETLNEELQFNIMYLEDIIKLQNRAVETLDIIEMHKVYLDTIKALKTTIQLLNDLSFILYHYINVMKN